MRTSRIALAVALLLNLAILIALITLYRPMYSLQPGNSADFWSVVARVDIGGASGGFAGSAAKQGDRWVYTYMGYEGPISYVIDDAVVMKDLPRVETLLAALPVNDDPANFPAHAYRRWKSLPSPYNTEPRFLAACIDEAVTMRIASAPATYPPDGFMFRQRLTAEQIARTADFYPANFVFELIYLSLLVWFALWPFIRNRSVLRKLMHLAIFPLLFYLPLWLGYCVCIYYRGALPGGILYPWLLWFTLPPLVSPAWDLSFLALPPFFNVINQGMPLTYTDYFGFKTMMEFHGPANVALRSLLLTAAYAVPCAIVTVHRAVRRRRDLARPGFPVLQSAPAGPSSNDS